MRNRVYWMILGGLSFWLPVIAVSVVLRENVNLWILNVVPLLGVTLLTMATWFITKHLPEWGWVLAGIYILGPVSMISPSLFIHGTSSSNVPGENTWIILFCFFPPMTLWLGL